MIKSIQGETEELMAFALNMARRTKQGFNLHYKTDLRDKIYPILDRLNSYIEDVKSGKCQKFDNEHLNIIHTLNPETHLFLTGYMPSVADFELAYLVEHFRWICEKNGIENPFSKYSELEKIYSKIKSLDGVE